MLAVLLPLEEDLFSNNVEQSPPMVGNYFLTIDWAKLICLSVSSSPFCINNLSLTWSTHLSKLTYSVDWSSKGLGKEWSITIVLDSDVLPAFGFCDEALPIVDWLSISDDEGRWLNSVLD